MKIENIDRRAQDATDAQTEARAIALVLEYYIAGAQDGLSKVPVGTLSRIATALAAKDEELAGALGASERFSVAWRDAERRAKRAEAQLAEANKALDAIIERSHNDPLGTSKVIDMRKIASRALEAQGGENG